jgi:hypothetical protein
MQSAGRDEPFRVGFLIAGVQKGGTSTLYRLLKLNPEVGLSSVKEVCFFDEEDKVDWSSPCYDYYHSFFPRRREARIFGEATPIYIYWPSALERVRHYNAAMKLILLFRDPISRAYSAWCHQRRRKREPLSFSEAIRAGRTRIADSRDIANRYFSYVERGFYADQLARARAHFPPENILALDCQQLSTDPCGLLKRVSRFLGVAAPVDKIEAIQVNARPENASGERITTDDVAFLADIFAPDLESFAGLIDFSIEYWPTVRVVRGTATAAEVASEIARPGFVAPGATAKPSHERDPMIAAWGIFAKRLAATLRRHTSRLGGL